MRVALVIDKFDPAGGGAECWTARHAEALIGDGHEVHIVARTVRGAHPRAVCHPVEAHCRTTAGRKLALPDHLAACLAELPVDVIHDMGAGWYADVFMPHYGTRRGIYTQQSKLLAAPERWLRPLAYRCLARYRRFSALERVQFRDAPGRATKRFIAVSNMVKADMMRFHGVPADRIDVVHNGVDIHRFRPQEDGDTRRTLRGRLGFSDDTTVFLLVAHDWDLKGLEALLRALCVMLKAGRDVGLVVVGPGAMRGRKFWGIPLGRPNRRYPRLARRWGCSHAVRFVGLQHDPVPYYQAADVYVQPSLYDACSLVVLEAMACGLPVITSRFNGASELIENGGEGSILRDPLDIAELAGSMTGYLDLSRRRAAGDAALRLARQHSARSNYGAVVQIYRQIVSRRGQPAAMPAAASIAVHEPRPAMAVITSDFASSQSR